MALQHAERKLASAVDEPRAAGWLLQQCQGQAEGQGQGQGQEGGWRPWRRRLPRWVALLRVSQVGQG